jgi:hypothetical protein
MEPFHTTFENQNLFESMLMKFLTLVYYDVFNIFLITLIVAEEANFNSILIFLETILANTEAKDVVWYAKLF